MYLYNANQLIRLKVNVADEGLENNVATNVSVNAMSMKTSAWPDDSVFVLPSQV